MLGGIVHVHMYGGMVPPYQTIPYHAYCMYVPYQFFLHEAVSQVVPRAAALLSFCRTARHSRRSIKRKHRFAHTNAKSIMSGRGKGGKGLGKGGAKRHRKVLRDNIQGM